MWDIFVSLFTEAADKHAPWMHKMIKGLDTSYIAGELRNHMQDRDLAKSRASKSHDTVLWDKYKKLRNKVTSLTEKAKKDYYQTLLAENMHKPSKLWKALKRFYLSQIEKMQHFYVMMTVSILPLFLLQIVITISSLKLDQNWQLHSQWLSNCEPIH